MNALTTNLCFVLLAATPAAKQSQPTLRLADGTSKAARLVAIDQQWKITFDDGSDANTAIDAAEVLSWGVPREPTGGDQILLADGSIIVGSLIELAPDKVLLESRLFGDLEVPSSRVRAILFRQPAKGIERDRFRRKAFLLRPRTDQVWLANGDTLDGVVAAIDDETIRLRQGERDVKLAIDTIAAVIFDSALVEATRHPALHTVVGFSDGSRIVADAIEIAKGKPKAKLETGKLTLSANAAKIVFLSSRDGKAIYLSDLTPVGYRHIPLLNLKWDYRANANVLGGELRCRGQLYLKGVGVHSASVLTYRVPEGTKRLVGRIGIDDSARGGGSVVFRVFVDDGSGKWQRKFESKAIRGTDPPEDISIDLTDARQISLMVDFADRGDVLDHADWLDIAFVR
ncbi:MAG: NPCBM/NEW2 domain-containing protein [Pirellulales bacterium]|nr:NPCBM/NEW2 domain-containing protein [Pirellulales bacterium]